MEDLIVTLLESLEQPIRMIVRGSEDELPNITRFANGIREVLGKYKSYFKLSEINDALDEIENDKFFVKNESYDFRDSVIERVRLYAIVKSVCEVLNNTNKSTIISAPNRYISNYIYCEDLLNLYESDRKNIKSVTLNRINSTIGDSITIVDEGLKNQMMLMEDKILEFKAIIKAASADEREKISKRMKYVLSLKIHDFERDIFYGLMDDFKVSKLIKNKQNESYKFELLGKIFWHTHKLNYHSDEPPNGSLINIQNKSAIKKIVSGKSKFRALI